ncbi:5-methylcytosine-specific restriction protein A [Microbacterium phyllosphaerae]|uniref:5-methylcytosine-specific restriction protein A n=1 Tax=Microbacterium phyllosphaerae TaxID=124798 RepID=A0ABS4WLQ5_9MICO|nr:HNH endonuclease signature motif containing protein [Microbacterium phyllosphaerae]MBP2376961.1 5-methylcytosine-specific restriction protein A [Microbacterium phyllosphaerae]
MSNPRLAPLLEAIERLSDAWADAERGVDLSRGELLGAHRAVGEMQRCLDGLHAELAAAIAHESRPELGPEGLAKQHGYRSAAAMIAATTGGAHGDAKRLITVGQAAAPRTNLLGEALPAKYPALATALAAGEISVAAAAVIVALLERVRLKVGTVRVEEAERLLVERAAGMTLDDVRTLVARTEAWLDPDGVAPKEREARDRRSLTMFERDGSFHLNLQTDIAASAPIKAAIQAYVTATFQARITAPDPGAPDADHRTVAMIQADALAAICEHAIACDNGGMPATGATVVVRVNLDDLTAGLGTAVIDGSDQPVSITTCRRMAAGGGIIPVVLGSEGEILDWGREKRLFTRAQRLALVERDGGCAMCSLPPQMTKAHHLRWWQRDTGPTDLNNGVLLCESCHHRIHDNGWDIRIEGIGVAARVWLIPPPHVDPARTPRLGGRARYDIAA